MIGLLSCKTVDQAGPYSCLLHAKPPRTPRGRKPKRQQYCKWQWAFKRGKCVWALFEDKGGWRPYWTRASWREKRSAQHKGYKSFVRAANLVHIFSIPVVHDELPDGEAREHLTDNCWKNQPKQIIGSAAPQAGKVPPGNQRPCTTDSSLMAPGLAANLLSKRGVGTARDGYSHARVFASTTTKVDPPIPPQDATTK